MGIERQFAGTILCWAISLFYIVSSSPTSCFYFLDFTNEKIIKDYIARKGLEVDFKINCLASKSIGGRKEEYPHVYVCMYICMYVFPKSLPKVLNQKIFYHLQRSSPLGV